LLAAAMAKPSNLLILDEPTNDLDLETLDLLQEMLGEYPGTILLVSHDRDFLDRVATSTLAAEGNGKWVEYAGGYSDMLAQRGEVAAAKPGAPKQKTARGALPQTTGTKLSFKDQHELKTLNAEIERLQAEIKKHEASWRNPACTIRTSKPSKPRPMRSPMPRSNSQPPRNAGWRWSCSAKPPEPLQ
jgi:ATP-binding cassette subfamily F protein uup